ncbi:peroxidase 19 [Ricinus communis]|uniref:peroxidase 19 n=1 Tax=Ricinus communis TaxID=3988 RepID=UPI00201AAEC5|nr:peroxidase 19 [Ricinus communis]
MPTYSSSSSSSSSSLSFVFTCLLILMLGINSSISILAKTTNTTRRPPRQLSVNYYARTCPQLEQLVGSVTSQQFKETPVSGPATIRLFFHDCFVEGCDASILISTRPGSKQLAEKDAEDNKNLRIEGFESIRKAKALVEGKCPGVVSCSDILAIAARDFVHLAGGPYYQVKKGRWDGKISLASRVTFNLPSANSTVDQLLKLFNSKGLTLQDLVVLSGAHTIGFAHCKQFVSRLYNYHGSKQPDPAIDPRLLKALKMSCPQFGGNEDIVAPFDVTTPFLFDHAYYGNLESKLGLLATDQALFLDPRTKPLVQQLGKDKQKFYQAFAQAMDKMGSIGVKRGRRHGEKRKDCSIHAS